MTTYNERKLSQKNERVVQILKDHSVPHYVLCGDIYADSMESGTDMFEMVVNISNMSTKELYEWLGY